MRKLFLMLLEKNLPPPAQKKLSLEIYFAYTILYMKQAIFLLKNL
jgi:hypothetical protein